MQEIQRKNPNKPIVILAHHSLAHLRDDEKMEVENLFSKYPVKLYLCGDTHEPWVRRENQILEITMGCSVNERGNAAVFSAGGYILLMANAGRHREIVKSCWKLKKQ